MNDRVQLALLVGCVAGKSIDPFQKVMIHCFFFGLGRPVSVPIIFLGVGAREVGRLNH